ncbi:hypothetical protein CATYP_10165 [Corynebacterium atypicum]|uniref:NYN domain-containing protein n=1 Tax=Corynebacterium atypicum TaxID=191610 RepID=A0ABN4DEK1_9CORY|nr:NYN domain-containing protein [Corynebacterium atypicum]AIG64848.1 hypothetical protein CATYP_10165 [Corynebacterium atypicum]
MLERTLVFVDTSYLLASFYNSWDTGARTQLEIDLPDVVCVLGQMVENQLHQPIHRQLWYDGIPDSGPHRYQRALRTCDGVRLRAGQLIEWGERRTQKAVDTRLVADMVLAAVDQQCSDIVLVSGDADMIPGVSEAARRGVRVHLYGFGWDSMSSALRHHCDTTTILDPREDFADSMRLEVLEGPIPPVVREKPIGDAEPPEEPGLSPIPESANPAARAHRDPARTGGEHTDRADGDAPATPTALSDAHVGGAHAEEKAAEGEAVAAQDRQFEAARSQSPLSHEGRDGAETSRLEQDPVGLGAPGNAAASPVERSLVDAASTQPTRHGEAEAASSESTDRACSTPAAPRSGIVSSDDVAEPPASGDVNGPAGEGAATDSSLKPRPKPSMMAPKRRLRSRYVPLPNEVWASAGYQTPFDVGQQYARWWYDNAATNDQRDQAHLLSGGGLPPAVDRPLLQFACETLHEYTLSESQRVNLRDGFHAGIRGVLINVRRDD